MNHNQKSPSPILRLSALTKKPMIIRRHETLKDKIWRYRGVLVVAGVPVLIVLLMVFVLFPRSLPKEPRSLHSIKGVGSSHTSASSSDAASSSSSSSSSSEGGSIVYNIVLDAGSTGSRIHIFKFKREGHVLKLISDGFHQLKPGLSSYRDEPQKAAQSLAPLMAEAVKQVPKEQQASTGLTLMATAGLRLLPGSKAEDILEAVRAYLATFPFQIKKEGVGIMDGAHEGAFAWLTLNYLLGKLGKGPRDTVAAIDLGGGSVQEAFALTEEEAKAAPEGYVTTMQAGGKTYYVYVHSYLGYGLMAARAKVIAAAADTSHPCFAKGKPLSYSYGDKTFQVSEVVEPGDFKRCSQATFKALEHDKGCGKGVPQEACSFNGAWRGKPTSMKRVYYVSSYFWDRAQDSGIIKDKGAVQWKTSPADFARRATAVCGKDSSELAKVVAGLPQAHAPYFCLDLVFCYTVLTQGFDLPENTELTLVKQVVYEGQAIEAAWPLGAAVNGLSS